MKGAGIARDAFGDNALARCRLLMHEQPSHGHLGMSPNELTWTLVLVYDVQINAYSQQF